MALTLFVAVCCVCALASCCSGRVARDGRDPMLARHGLEERTKFKYTMQQGQRVNRPPHGYPKRGAAAAGDTSIAKDPAAAEAVLLDEAVRDTTVVMGSKLRE